MPCKISTLAAYSTRWLGRAITTKCSENQSDNDAPRITPKKKKRKRISNKHNESQHSLRSVPLLESKGLLLLHSHHSIFLSFACAKQHRTLGPFLGQRCDALLNESRSRRARNDCFLSFHNLIEDETQTKTSASTALPTQSHTSCYHYPGA